MRRVGDLCHVCLLGLSSATSALSAFHGNRIRIVKRAEPVGVRGERSEIKPRLTGPIKRRAERQARSRSGMWSCVESRWELGQSGAWSLQSVRS